MKKRSGRPDLLGIDGRAPKLKSQRDWFGLKDFFKTKLQEIQHTIDEKKGGSGKDKLLAKILDILKRQLSEMSFFKDILGIADESPDPMDLTKLSKAPLGKLGCESAFSWFDNRVEVSGGTESVQAISRKKAISTNGLFCKYSLRNLLIASRNGNGLANQNNPWRLKN